MTSSLRRRTGAVLAALGLLGGCSESGPSSPPQEVVVYTSVDEVFARPIWRYQDEDNYYVARANALEDNVVAYKVEKGKRSNLGVEGAGSAYGVKTEIPSGQWNSLRVVADGGLFEIYSNDRKLFEVKDATFAEAGRVGLWTKADSVTYFDDLTVVRLDRRAQ